jgi:hypothetical protein
MFQIVSVSGLLGIGLLFSLSFMMTYLTSRDVEGFFIWLPVFAGFVVWAGLLPLWVLVLSVIVLVLITINRLRMRRVQ